MALMLSWAALPRINPSPPSFLQRLLHPLAREQPGSLGMEMAQASRPRPCQHSRIPRHRNPVRSPVPRARAAWICRLGVFLALLSKPLLINLKIHGTYWGALQPSGSREGGKLVALGPDSSSLCFPGGERRFAAPCPVPELQFDARHALAIAPCRAGARHGQGTTAAWESIRSAAS